jgi:hypothetical protein
LGALLVGETFKSTAESLSGRSDREGTPLGGGTTKPADLSLFLRLFCLITNARITQSINNAIIVVSVSIFFVIIHKIIFDVKLNLALILTTMEVSNLILRFAFPQGLDYQVAF